MKMSEHHTTETHHLRIPETEQRTRTRIPDLTRSEVWLSTPSEGGRLGHMNDLSLGGFAVHTADLSGLPVGSEVAAYFKEGSVRARIRYVTNDTSAGYRIGMAWVRPKSPVVVKLLKRCIREICAHIDSGSEGE